MCFTSVELLASILLLIHNCSSSSVSQRVIRKCSSDDNCAHQLACDQQTNTCICPQPYFWREDIRACFGCAPGWLDLQANKCLFYAVRGLSGVTWNQAGDICKDLMAQPMFINTAEQFQSLQVKIEDILNGETALAAVRYFDQGAWVNINRQWIESYTWCNDQQTHEDLDCVQVRQNSSTNTICLQYVSCTTTAQFICEAKSLPRLKLEQNIARSKQFITNTRKRRLLLFGSGSNNVPNSQPIMGTKPPSSWSADHVTNLISNGVQAIGHVASAFSNIFGKNTPQNTNPPAPQPVIEYVQQQQQQMPAPLAENGGSSSKGLFSTQNLLIFGGIGAVLLIMMGIMIMCCCCAKKKSKSRSRASVRSMESGMSGASNE